MYYKSVHEGGGAQKFPKICSRGLWMAPDLLAMDCYSRKTGLILN